METRARALLVYIFYNFKCNIEVTFDLWHFYNTSDQMLVVLNAFDVLVRNAGSIPNKPINVRQPSDNPSENKSFTVVTAHWND